MAEGGASPLIGQTLDGYRVESLLGRGGMGEVFKAFDTDLHRWVAIKMVAKQFSEDEDFVRRFEREARSASAINHANVAQIYAFGRHLGSPYFVMEFVEGSSLREVVHVEGRLSGSRCVDLLRQAASGLQAALGCGIIHRDIKPANLMLTEDSKLKIVDFGLARRQTGEADQTRSSMVLGTPAYMSPEQALSSEVDFRADIYSLGATFYHLFSGAPPFTADTPIAVMMKQVREIPKPLQEANPRVPSSVAAVVDRMLAKEPDGRYQSYEELIADLARLRISGPAKRPHHSATTVLSRPLPTPERDKRHASSLVWTAVVAILVLLSLGYLGLNRRVGELLERLGETRSPEVVEAPPPASSPRPLPARSSGPAFSAEEVHGQQEEELPRPAARPNVSSWPRDSGSKGSPLPPPAYPPERLTRFLAAAQGAGTQSNLRQIQTMIQIFLAENGYLPGSTQELVTWSDLPPEAWLDAWKREIVFRPLGGEHYRLLSMGPDGIEGSADDIVMEDGYIVQGGLSVP